MKATSELKKEHDGIEIMLQVLKTVADKFKHRQQVKSEDLDGILDFLSIFVDKCHHGKEEVYFFPALEVAGMSREDDPIGLLLSEHKQGRKLVMRLKDVITEYKSGKKSNAEDAHLIINEYVALLTQHIDKENAILFPMADAKLDSNKDNEILEAFEQLERERIGFGKHDEFHALLEQLQGKYLL